MSTLNLETPTLKYRHMQTCLMLCTTLLVVQMTIAQQIAGVAVAVGGAAFVSTGKSASSTGHLRATWVKGLFF